MAHLKNWFTYNREACRGSVTIPKKQIEHLKVQNAIRRRLLFCWPSILQCCLSTVRYEHKKTTHKECETSKKIQQGPKFCVA